MKNSIKIPISRTELLESDIKSVLEPLNSGWLVQGPKVREFENAFCDFTNSKYAIAVTSCTSALYLSLSVNQIGPGDEVIVPAFTWISSANVVEHLGAKVVFADIDLESFNINPEDIIKKITSKTKAIMPVHLFGLPANMKEISAIAKSQRILLVEDAACGFGAQYYNDHVGTMGNLGCFSFHPRKTITTGEGGMVTTNDLELSKKLRRLRDHGALVSDLQRHQGKKPFLLPDFSEAGFNLRMTDIQAALGISQMKRATKILHERIDLAENYNTAFSELDWLRPQASKSKEIRHGYQSYACLVNPEEAKILARNLDFKKISKLKKFRDNLMEQLNSVGISTRPSTHCIHTLTYYSKKYNLKPLDYPNAYLASISSISLPLFNGLKTYEQDYVINSILQLDY